MNYRHAYHAGNFADVMKHVLLARIIQHLAAKPKPFRFIDTHAGIGLYDLASVEASRTEEWRTGIGQMDAPFEPEIEALLSPWRDAVSASRTRVGRQSYPGSPLIALHMLRSDDRALLVEKHPADRIRLTETIGWDHRAKVIELDGWLAVRSFIPPKERRGLVFIDPPFEQPGEISRCSGELLRAHRRWPSGILVLWYPIKRLSDRDELSVRLAAEMPAPTLRLELMVSRPNGTKLAGSGLVVVNPPWTLAGEASRLLPALGGRLASGASWSCDDLVSEGETSGRAAIRPRRGSA